MKTILLSVLMALLGVTAFAQSKANVVDSSNNKLTLRVLPTKDLHNIPVQVSMQNPDVPMACVQCHFQVSDTLATFAKDKDALSFLCRRTERWKNSHQTIPILNPKNHPGTLMVMVISPLNESFNDVSGPVVEMYIDGSRLADGTYTVSMIDANMVWTDRKTVCTYLTPDQQATFRIKNGKLKIK